MRWGQQDTDPTTGPARRALPMEPSMPPPPRQRTPLDDRSLGELGRGVDALVAAVDGLSAKVDERFDRLTTDVASTYLRKDDGQIALLDARVSLLEVARVAEAANMRQLRGWLLTVAGSGIVGALLFLLQILVGP